MINFNDILDTSTKLTNFKWVKDKMLEYLEKCSTPTFRGLLNYLGITSRNLKELVSLVENNNKNAIRVYELLEKFKNTIEAKLEEYLIYQGQHPDLQGKHLDFKSIQWVLERQNPSIYKPSKVSEMKLEMKNESGYSLENNNGQNS